MHELSIAEAVRQTAVRYAEGRHVTVVSVRVGHLRQVVPSSLQFYWEISSRGTACEGARLEVEQVALRLACRDCEAQWQPELPVFRCSSCEGSGVEIVAGDELSVQYIEVEDEEMPCIAPA